MKKSLTSLILTVLLAIVLNIFLPWWAIMLAAFLSGFLIDLKNVKVFLIPFLSIMLLWMTNAFLLSSSNDFTLSTKIANLLRLGGNVFLLTLITGIIGGLAAGFAGITGTLLKRLTAKD
jgi:hypothetical protein